MHRGLIVLVALAGFAAAPASASALTIGSLDPANTDPGFGGDCVASNFNLIQGSVTPGGPSYTVPEGGGTISGWSTRWGVAGSSTALEVWHSDPMTTGQYVLIAKDSESLAPDSSGVSSFPVSIPVQAGDVIGIGWPTANKVHCTYTSPFDANTTWGASGSPTPGSKLNFSGFIVPRDLLNLSANLQQTADLAVSQVPSRSTVVAGNAVNFVLTATNSGPSPQTATVVDTLPAGMTFFSAAAGGGSCSGGQTVTCQVPLAVGGSQTISIVAVAGSPGPKTNSATISSSATDVTPGDNTSTATVQVVSVPKLGKVSKKAKKHHETFKFTLDQGATVKIAIQRSGKQVATVSGNGKPGSNSFRSRKLSGGHYKAALTATTAAGSAAKTVSFTIP